VLSYFNIRNLRNADIVGILRNFGNVPQRAVDGRVTPTAVYTVKISEAFPGAHVLLLLAQAA